MQLAKTFVHTLTPCISHKYSSVLTAILHAFVNSVPSLTLHCTQLAWIQHAFNFLLKCSGVKVNYIYIYKHTHGLHSFWIFNSSKFILARI